MFAATARSCRSTMLGFNRRLWIPRNPARSSLSAACLLLFRDPCRRFLSQPDAAATAAVGVPSPSISVAFLVDSCGLSPYSAANSIKKLKRVNQKAGRNPEAVLELFRSRGFSGSQIARIVAARPYVLYSNRERTLKPKLDCLRAEGFSETDITKLVTSAPGLLFMSCEETIKPNLDVLRSIFPLKSDILAAVARSNWLMCSKLKVSMLPNAAALRAISVPEERISRLIMQDSRIIIREHQRFCEYIVFLKAIGLSPTKFTYIVAVSSLSRLSEVTLRKKISFFGNLGFTEEVFFSAFKQVPTISGLSEYNIKKTIILFRGFGLRDDEIPSFFGKKAPALFILSERNITKSMDFLVRTLNWTPRDVLLHPRLLALSLERRLIPRAFVRATLLSKGLLKGDRVYSGLFLIAEDNFVKNYVIKFQNELPQLLEEYEKLKPKDVRNSVSMETSA